MTKTKLPESKSFAVGDRVQPSWSAGKNRVGVIKATHSKKPLAIVDWVEGPPETIGERAVAFSSLNLLPENVSGSNLQVGDRVTFTQHWYGEDRECKGEIVRLEGQTAIVHFDAPHLEGPGELQAPIGIFALAKIPEIKMLPEPDETQAEIDRLERLGLPPPGAWIDLSTPAGSNFRQAKWKSREAIFDSGSNPETKLKSRYIGKENSAEHKEAIAQVERRKRIKELKQKIAAQT